MIGRITIQSKDVSKSYLVQAVKCEAWVIFHQEFLKNGNFFRSIYVPDIKRFVMTHEEVKFEYDQERYIFQKSQAFFDLFEEIGVISYN